MGPSPCLAAHARRTDHRADTSPAIHAALPGMRRPKGHCVVVQVGSVRERQGKFGGRLWCHFSCPPRYAFTGEPGHQSSMQDTCRASGASTVHSATSRKLLAGRSVGWLRSSSPNTRPAHFVSASGCLDARQRPGLAPICTGGHRNGAKLPLGTPVPPSPLSLRTPEHSTDCTTQTLSWLCNSMYVRRAGDGATFGTTTLGKFAGGYCRRSTRPGLEALDPLPKTRPMTAWLLLRFSPSPIHRAVEAGNDQRQARPAGQTSAREISLRGQGGPAGSRAVAEHALLVHHRDPISNQYLTTTTAVPCRSGALAVAELEPWTLAPLWRLGHLLSADPDAVPSSSPSRADHSARRRSSARCAHARPEALASPQFSWQLAVTTVLMCVSSSLR